MKKTVLFLLLAISTAYTVQAQATLVHAVSAGIGFGRMMHNKNKAAETTPTSSYQGKSFPMVRTPAAEISGGEGAQIQAVETELDRCHTALVATPNGLICTPEQLATLQTAMRNLAKAKSSNIPAYQQEAAFYLAENTRRQQTASLAPAPN